MAKTRRRTTPRLELPPTLWRQLVRLAERVGLSPRGGQPLADAIAQASRLYTDERGHIPHKSVDVDILAARLLFYAVRDFSKVESPLEALWQQGFRPAGSALRVLDVGAGVGASGLGVARFAARHGLAGVRLTALDREEEALSVARALFEGLGDLDGWLAKVSLTTRVGDAAAPLPEGPFDVVVVSFVLNEMLLALAPEARATRGAELVRHFFAPVAPGGALVVLEPALKETSRTLSAVRDVLARDTDGPRVVAPCLHTAPCPMLRGERDWCHQELDLALPAPWDELARGAGLRFEGLSYSYLTLRHAEAAHSPLAAGARRLRVVSDPLASKGKHELFGCGDGEIVRLTRLDRDASLQNEPFVDLRRGDVCTVAGGLQKGPGLRLGPDCQVTVERHVSEA